MATLGNRRSTAEIIEKYHFSFLCDIRQIQRGIALPPVGFRCKIGAVRLQKAGRGGAEEMV